MESSTRNFEGHQHVNTMPDTEILVGKYDVESRTPKVQANTFRINSSNRIRKKNMRNISGLIQS